MNILRPPEIYVSRSTIPGAGRGVFTNRNLEADELIEVSPVIEFSDPNPPFDDEDLHIHYLYRFGGGLAIALGYGSLYNHSDEPNAVYIKKVPEKIIEFRALYAIPAFGEITVNYNGDPHDKTPVHLGPSYPKD